MQRDVSKAKEDGGTGKGVGWVHLLNFILCQAILAVPQSVVTDKDDPTVPKPANENQNTKKHHLVCPVPDCSQGWSYFGVITSP